MSMTACKSRARDKRGLLIELRQGAHVHVVRAAEGQLLRLPPPEVVVPSLARWKWNSRIIGRAHNTRAADNWRQRLARAYPRHRT